MLDNRIRKVGSLLALVLVLVLFQGLAVAQAQEVGADELPDEEEAGLVTADATLEEVAERPARFTGDVVQVEGMLEDVIDPTAFTLQTEAAAANPVLVLSAGEAGFGLNLEEMDEQEVEVTGEVFVFDIVRLERELGFDLDDELFEPFEGQAAVVARDVDPLEGPAADLPAGELPALPAVELVDAEDNVLGEADLTVTQAGRLVVELTAEGFDPATQPLAIAEAGVCEAPDFESVGDVIVDLADVRLFQDADTFIGETPVEAGVVEDEDQVQPDAAAAVEEFFGPAQEVTLEELTTDPASFLGLPVEVQAPVARILNPADLIGNLDELNIDVLAFTLETEDPADNDVLVVSVTDVVAADDLDALVDQEATVAGLVVPVDIRVIEQQFGLDLVDEALQPFVGGPMIVANVVRPAGEGAEVDEADTNEFFAVVPNFDPAQLFDQDGAALIVRDGPEADAEIIACAVIEADAAPTVDADVTPLADVIADPAGFAEPVVVEDEVAEVVDPLAFTLGDQEVLVLSTDPAGFPDEVLAPGAVVRIPGQPGVFERTAFEEEFGINLRNQLFRPFEGDPFLEVDPADVEVVEPVE